MKNLYVSTYLNFIRTHYHVYKHDFDKKKSNKIIKWVSYYNFIIDNTYKHNMFLWPIF